MSSIFNLLEEKPVNNLSIYFTAGFPELEDTEKVIQELSNAAVDFIEVGLPYSDPLADSLEALVFGSGPRPPFVESATYIHLDTDVVTDAPSSEVSTACAKRRLPIFSLYANSPSVKNIEPIP